MRQPSAVRQRTEDYERASLSGWAALAVDTKGRERAEDSDPLRTAFQTDRDRVAASQAFSRLAGKTQSFVAAPDARGARRDRMRLMHALAVAQIGRTIARALRLNEDLVEAIALGHDLGNTSFGPAGEEALTAFTDEPFRHHEQSLRVVETLERGGQGLNLTWEVREGILNHPWSMPPPSTLEGQAVRIANRVAVLAGDLGAALDAGTLSADELPGVVATLGAEPSDWVAAFLQDVVATSLDAPEVALSPRMESIHATLREFLGERVHGRPAARAQTDRAVHCLRSLAVYHLEDPSGLPDSGTDDDPLVVRVVDEIAGLTDEEALADFRRLFLPEGGPTG